MSSPPTINRFKGTDWEECNEFIVAIREVAWKEGKFRDLAWIADFAALRFSHKALSWHSRLPRDVREDWEKLQVALLDRWPSPEDDDEPRIEPTPAAAPSLSNDKANRPLQGALKLVIDGSDTDSYFGLDTDGCGVVTNEVKAALRFRCSSLPNATLLERIDGPRHSWLGVQWKDTNPNLKIGSTDPGYPVLVESLKLKTSWKRDSLYQLASCTVSENREVILFWENEDASKITLGIFLDDSFLYLAADPEAYSKHYPDEKRAKIFIEQIHEGGWRQFIE